MYVIKSKTTGKYWNGKSTGSETDMYTSDLQEAYAFHEKEDFSLEKPLDY